MKIVFVVLISLSAGLGLGKILLSQKAPTQAVDKFCPEPEFVKKVEIKQLLKNESKPQLNEEESKKLWGKIFNLFLISVGLNTEDKKEVKKVFQAACETKFKKPETSLNEKPELEVTILEEDQDDVLDEDIVEDSPSSKKPENAKARAKLDSHRNWIRKYFNKKLFNKKGTLRNPTKYFNDAKPLSGRMKKFETLMGEYKGVIQLKNNKEWVILLTISYKEKKKIWYGDFIAQMYEQDRLFYEKKKEKHHNLYIQQNSKNPQAIIYELPGDMFLHLVLPPSNELKKKTLVKMEGSLYKKKKKKNNEYRFQGSVNIQQAKNL